MHTVREELQAHRQKDFVWVERIATLLDSKFAIGGFRFGVDPVLNLVPYGGQLISFVVSMMLVVVMFRNGVRTKVVVKMILNIIFDAILGTIPLFGQVFDFFNRANERNIKLLRTHYFENKNQGNATALILGVVGILVLITALTLYVMWLVAGWSWNFLHGLF